MPLKYFPLLSILTKELQYFPLTDPEGVKILGRWAPQSYWHQPQSFLTTRWWTASPLQLGICGTGAKTRKQTEYVVWSKTPQVQASVVCPDPGLYPLNLRATG